MDFYLAIVGSSIKAMIFSVSLAFNSFGQASVGALQTCSLFVNTFCTKSSGEGNLMLNVVLSHTDGPISL